MDNIEAFDPACLDDAFYAELNAAVEEAFAEGKEALECAPTLRSAELPAPVTG